MRRASGTQRILKNVKIRDILVCDSKSDIKTIILNLL